MNKKLFARHLALPLLAAWAAACGSSAETGSGGAPSGAAGASTRGGGGSGGDGSGASSSVATHFPGAGRSFSSAPLSPASGPDTASDCSTPPPIGAAPQVISQATTCFFGATSNPNAPAAAIEQIVEVLNGKKVVHIRVTFDPAFVDNTYGVNAIGWGGPPDAGTAAPAPMMPGGKAPKPPKTRSGHTFGDLVGSDHVEMQLLDASGTLKLHFDVDYVSQDASSPCGYRTLGVTGGDGKMIVGDASSVLAVATSLDRDLNGCGYCETVDSPATDPGYTPNPATPNWDYRVVYELWIDADAFGSVGFGSALIESVHASPSKLSENTVSVAPKPCPPGWDVPVCAPSASGEGIECGGSGTPDGGTPGACPPGFVPDLASEGRFCVPE